MMMISLSGVRGQVQAYRGNRPSGDAGSKDASNTPTSTRLYAFLRCTTTDKVQMMVESRFLKRYFERERRKVQVKWSSCISAVTVCRCTSDP